MLKIYCSSCGLVHQYSLSKPNFCTKCGLSFNNISKNTINKTNNSAALVEIEATDGQEADVLNVPKINNLDIEISSTKINPQKILDIVKTSSPEEYEEVIDYNQNHLNIDNEKFLEDFAQEAGALRPKIREHKQNGKKK